MLDLNGGTGLLSEALFIAARTLRASYFLGRRRVMRRNALHRVNQKAPVGRLNIDGESYYGG